MIALPHHLPFVKVGTNSITPCQDHWLDQVIIDASAESNVPEWFATDISKGIQQYLQHSYEGTVIETEELFTKISSTLNEIGLPEVASKIDRSPPPLRISLTDLARRAGEAYELAFFQLLEDRCQEAIHSGATCVEFHGLFNCVRTLRRSRKWSMTADKLRSEIETRIDEFRSMGELANPVFNVTVIL
ncbi:MAG: hypothetical protein P1V20_02475 [Verrucomicrobiales bacterium]|nr:hypothetical protein [Verrucomicrobiales bacterium]